MDYNCIALNRLSTVTFLLALVALIAAFAKGDVGLLFIAFILDVISKRMDYAANNT